MMRIFWGLSFLVWIAISSTASTSAPPSAWVQPVTVTHPAQWTPNPVGQNYLLLDQQANVASGETYFRRVFQIVSEAGRSDGAQVNISFDPSYQTLAIHHLRLRRNQQEFDRYDPAKVQFLQREQDLERQLYNGERSALIILDDVRIGDTIDLAYTLMGRNPVFGGHFIDLAYLGWGAPVQELRYRLIKPSGRTLRHQERGPSSSVVTVNETTHGQEWLWVRRDLTTIEWEDKTPAWQVVYPFLEVSEFADWGAVVAWALPLYDFTAEPTPLVRETLASIKASAVTPEARALAALRFVQEEIRYLGIEMGPGSHRPSAPDAVLQRRFGDCKDKSLLLAALFHHLGFEAAPVLVNSTLRDSVKEWLPSPYAFDHVITALDLGGRRYLLDPTMSYQRGATLALRHVGTYGPYLRIARDNWNLENSHLGENDTYQAEVRETYRTVAFDQPTALTVTTTYRGTAANYMRAYFATRSREQIGRDYLDYYTRYYPDISSAQPVDFTDNPGYNVFTVTERYRIQKLFVQTPPGGPVLQAEFYPTVIDDYLRTPNLGQRKHPYAINHPARVTCATTVELPDEWQIASAQQTVRDAAFEFDYAISGTGRTVSMNYQWQSLAAEVPVARLAEFAAHTAEARALLGYQLIYNTDIAPAGGPYPLQWPMVLLAATVAIAGTLAGWRLVRRRNPVPPSPPLLRPAESSLYSYGSKSAANLEGLGGWLVLVAIGLVLRPCVLLLTLVSSHRGYFNHAVWLELTTPGGTAYEPYFAGTAAIELALNLGLLIFSGVLLALFFRRSYLFPRAMQVFLGCLLVAACFGVWTAHTLSIIGLEDRKETYQNLIQALVAAAVWIPYFQVSRRVKQTFVR
jgi:transglutaminase-like putative cysteine protease